MNLNKGAVVNIAGLGSNKSVESGTTPDNTREAGDVHHSTAFKKSQKLVRSPRDVEIPNPMDTMNI